MLTLSKAIPVMARTKDFNENEVLARAVDIFWNKGYNGTSMQDLVDGLGISRSSLYDTYGDKHALFLNALESYKTNGSAQVLTIINNALSAKAAIKQLMEYVTDSLLSDNQQKGCFLVNAEVEVASHDKQVSDLICQNDQQLEDAFYRVIKAGQKDGEIDTIKDARALARFTFNTIKGIRVTAKTTTDKTIFADIISMAMAVFE